MHTLENRWQVTQPVLFFFFFLINEMRSVSVLNKKRKTDASPNPFRSSAVLHTLQTTCVLNAVLILQFPPQKLVYSLFSPQHQDRPQRAPAKSLGAAVHPGSIFSSYLLFSDVSCPGIPPASLDLRNTHVFYYYYFFGLVPCKSVTT